MERVEKKPRPDLALAELRKANLSKVNLYGASLYGADLSYAKLEEAKLGLADLSFAVVRQANLYHADLIEARLVNADLTQAHLVATNLFRANLHNANLSGTELGMANMNGANLEGAEFSGAQIGLTSLGWLDLSRVKGLESVKHLLPSSVGIDTLCASNGRIPEIFLRGCGVPEPFIANMKALVASMDPIQFYSCFISYSTKDQDFADRLHADLQSKGVRCWFAPHDVQAGKKVKEQIDEAIRLYDKVLLLLSSHSIGSEWVRAEIARARKREIREHRRMLFPLRLVDFDTLRDWECFDADTGKDSAREIREYFIPDFSRWKDHGSYLESFNRLLRDLRAGAEEKLSAAPEKPPARGQ
jgi:hypothetical protein